MISLAKGDILETPLSIKFHLQDSSTLINSPITLMQLIKHMRTCTCTCVYM